MSDATLGTTIHLVALSGAVGACIWLSRLLLTRVIEPRLVRWIGHG